MNCNEPEVKDLKDAPEMAKACSLMLAKKEFDAGNYGTAKSSLENKDINYSYDGVSVA